MTKNNRMVETKKKRKGIFSKISSHNAMHAVQRDKGGW